MKETFAIKQSRELIYDQVPKMPGVLTPQRAVEMFELTLELFPNLVCYVGSQGRRSMYAHGLALQCNKRGKLITGFDLTKMSGIDILHLEGECSVTSLAFMNHNGYIWANSDDSFAALANRKLIRTADDYRLYCNLEPDLKL